ncbi:PH domain-containing protein [Natronorubrum sp. FCH18a]|uniref:PH domain-containing protein n=1 Tax=Natronorubrum sp. FCH18a TaxID=3447018 RepID=UPI003F518753
MNRLHPLSAVSKAVSGAISGLMIPLTLVVLSAEYVEFVETSWLFVLAPLGFLVGLGYGIAYYYRFTYELTTETVDVASGVVSRQVREIPYRRIQNVDVRQDLLHRLFGVAVVSIETAGGGDTEATLNFVTDDEARRLQSEIRRLTAATEESADTDDRSVPPSEADAPADDVADSGRPRDGRDGTLLFELEVRELLLYAGTAIRPSTGFLPVFLVLFLTGGDTSLLPQSVAELSVAVLAASSVVLWLIATYALSGLVTVTRYYGFRLERAGNDFVYERGLIERYSGSIPVEKVQSVTITDNPLQRLFGYAGLSVETAGYGPESDGGSQSTVPFADEARVYRFVERITGADRPQFSAHPSMARRRYLGRYAILAALAVAAAYVVARGTALERWYLAAVAFAAVPVAAHLKWANMGYYVGEDHLVVRRGFWRRQTTVIPYYRIQTVSTRRSIFQRRLGLASLVVDTASSRTFSRSVPTIDDVDLEEARGVRETSRERLQRTLRERARGDDVGLTADIA